MKKIVSAIFISVILVCAAAPVQAKNFGVGIIVGEPTGLSLKKWVSGRDAVDGALAWSFLGYDMIYLHADYLMHNFSIIPVSQGSMPLYFGIGGRLGLGENHLGLGARVPFGANYIFSPAPVDIFLELAAVLDLIPATRFDAQAALGIRYWF
jgi:hypothetical protein